MVSTGDLVGDRYRLDEPIAAGGIGEVWRATDTVLGRIVAVKVLRAQRSVDPEFQARFRDEARTMAALRHPGVADVFDYGETADGEHAYLVMQHVDGQPLDRRIAEAGRLGTAETMAIVAQAARALHAVHEAGVVHRDVKPGNLIVEPGGTVVLVDFGVARSASRSATLTGVNEVVGTALYIAPEQISKQPVGPAADIYALGAVAYQCLAGRPPFLGDNPITLAMRHLHDDPPPLPADVPTDARGLVATAMAKEPARRYPSAAAMAEGADAVAGRPAEAAVTQRLPAPVAVAGPRASRRKWAVAALIAVAVLGAALALALRSGSLPSTPPSGPVVPTSGAGTTQKVAPDAGRSNPAGSARPSATGPGAARGTAAGNGGQPATRGATAAASRPAPSAGGSSAAAPLVVVSPTPG